MLVVFSYESYWSSSIAHAHANKYFATYWKYNSADDFNETKLSISDLLFDANELHSAPHSILHTLQGSGASKESQKYFNVSAILKYSKSVYVKWA